MTASGINTGETVDPKDNVVVIPFPAIQQGQSLRLRIAETYTAPVSYRLEGDTLVFDRSLGQLQETSDNSTSSGAMSPTEPPPRIPPPPPPP